MSIRKSKNTNYLSSESASDETVSYSDSNGSLEEDLLEEDLSEDNNIIETHHRYSIEEILIENSPYKDNRYLIHRLLKDSLLQNKCYKCKRDPIWKDKPLVLQLDHINGVNNDNRIDNLRLLCPNCHSQTDTYTGKNNVKKRKCVSCDTKITGKYDTCEECYKTNDVRNIINYNKSSKCACGNQIWKKSNQCKLCKTNKSRKFNVSKDELEDMLFNQNLTRVEIGKKYDVSSTTVGKRCKEYNIAHEKN